MTSERNVERTPRALNREQSATLSDRSNDSSNLSLSCLVSSVESKGSEVLGSRNSRTISVYRGRR